MTVVHDCASAVAACRHTQFDALLLDYGLRAEHGIDLLPQLDAADVHRPGVVLLFSGHEPSMFQPLLTARSVDAVLHKPMQVPELRAAIEHWVGPLPGRVPGA